MNIYITVKTIERKKCLIQIYSASDFMLITSQDLIKKKRIITTNDTFFPLSVLNTAYNYRHFIKL